jgi:flotillin
VAAADSEAIKGENTALAEVAQSNATRREREAEALRRATAAEKIQSALALQEAYQAEQEAEKARCRTRNDTQEADVLLRADIQKRKLELEAEAQPNMPRLAKGQDRMPSS